MKVHNTKGKKKKKTGQGGGQRVKSQTEKPFHLK